METFFHRLEKAIKRSGLSRPEFAARAGVGTSALAKWLSGKLTPKSEQLLNLAKAADVSMEWLLTGDTDEKPLSMDGRLDDVVSYLRKIAPEQLSEPNKEAEVRAFWRDIFEGEDERFAAGGNRDAASYILGFADLLESSGSEFKNALKGFSEALERAEFVSDSDTEKLILQKWQEVAASAKRLYRRQRFLISEIRAKKQIEEW